MKSLVLYDISIKDKQPDLEPPWDPQPKVSNDQLPGDIRSIRDVVSGVKDAKIADWTLNPFNDDTDMNASHVDVPDWAYKNRNTTGIIFHMAISVIFGLFT
ncbi:MAG: hypothetical protein CVV28_11170 [Methanobacteriales archaeon HGW-Methanobacteriales-1]|nr:MAG: hypothetical protein CVV28_11170 [Methanobacteriales archaeon HGW-Methanobacteriales-1]